MTARPTQFQGLDALVIDHSSGVGKIAIVCTKCGHKQVGSSPGNFPPDRAVRPFIQAGWKVVRKGVRATCPACQTKDTTVDAVFRAEREREEKRIAELEAEEKKRLDDLKLAEETRAAQAAADRISEEKARTLLDAELTKARLLDDVPTRARPLTPKAALPVKAEPKESMTVLQQSRSAMVAQAKMHGLFQQHFNVIPATDPPQGTYDAGWSDQKVSEETGLSVAEVVRWRETVYGRLHDARTGNLERAIAQVRMQIEADRKALQEMVDQHQKSSIERLSKLERELDDIKKAPK